MALSDKQRRFIDEYLKCWNAAEAARLAGYSEKTARSIGSENLTKPDIEAEIKRRLDESAMSADEVLSRLAEQARATIGDFVSLDEAAQDGKQVSELRFDFTKAVKAGKMHLIKSLRQDKDGNWRLELHDAQAALVHLGRHHKLFTDQVSITDWREEARRAGLDDASIERIVKDLANKLAANLATGPTAVDGGSPAASEGAG